MDSAFHSDVLAQKNSNCMNLATFSSLLISHQQHLQACLFFSCIFSLWHVCTMFPSMNFFTALVKFTCLWTYFRDFWSFSLLRLVRFNPLLSLCLFLWCVIWLSALFRGSYFTIGQVIKDWWSLSDYRSSLLSVIERVVSFVPPSVYMCRLPVDWKWDILLDLISLASNEIHQMFQ